MELQDYVDARLVHEIHTSERKSFRGCRRRWDWIFRGMYYPSTTAKPLEFGVAFHAAMEVLYDPTTWSWDRNVVLAKAKIAFADKNKEQFELYKQTRQYEFLEATEPGKAREDYKERVALAVSMLDYYGGKVMPVVDQHWKPLEVEIEFIVPIQNPADGSTLWCKCDQCWARWRKALDGKWDDEATQIGEYIKESWRAIGADAGQGDVDAVRRTLWQGLPVCLGGRLDMLAEDEHGDYWIVDWKTSARMSKDNDAFLYLDDQIGSYVMALRRKLNLNVRGFLYVELRKAQISSPQRNKSQRLGRWFSVNKQQAVTPELYRETVSVEDAAAYEAGLYDEYLQFLEDEGMEFHRRYQIHKSDTELEEIERMLWQEVSDMTNPDLLIYPNPGRFNCQNCAFRPPCQGMFAGEDVPWMLNESGDYTKRTKHYWEEKIRSTDKGGGE